MADGYWSCEDANQTNIFSTTGKRPRYDYEVPGSFELPSFLSHEDRRDAPRVARDIEAIAESYDRYLREVGMPSSARELSNSPMSDGLPSEAVDDPHMVPTSGGMDLGMAGTSQNMGFGDGTLEMALPPGASNTLFVVGLPVDCTQREASHIFRPFPGFKEVRLVNKADKSGHPFVLGFVDFTTPAQAARVIYILQGYKFDEHDENSGNLTLQFARQPGLRSGGGPCGKH